MNNNLLKVGIILMLIITCFCGCSNKAKSKPDEETILNTPYSITSSMSLAIKESDILQKYGKPNIIRKQNGYTYEIRNLSDGSKFFVFYKVNIVVDKWRLKKLLNSDDFNQLTPKQSTVEDVIKIDPYFKLFEYSEDKSKGISEHRLKNNALINLEYKKLEGVWVVDSIQYKDQDPSLFELKLLPEDKDSLK